jgi:DNA-binding transcriptional ArsR family regulator
MAVTEQTENMDADDLSDADRAILDQLKRGARTKGYLVDHTGYHRNTIGQSLKVLEAAEIVKSIHESTALYEVVEDPREERETE